MLVPKVNARFSLGDTCSALVALAKKTSESNNPNLYYLNHGRAGLRVALTAFDLPVGSRIGISAFNCYTVMNAIQQAGHRVVFIDTTDNFTLDLQDLNAKKNNLDALIVTHLFGIPNDLPTIKKLCPIMPIIEDCAHSFLSSSVSYKTGTVGDFAVFSIGQGKFPSIGDGGILKVNNKLYAGKVKSEIEKLKRYSIFEELTLLVRLVLTRFVHNPFVYKWFSLPNKKKQHRKKNINSNYYHKESLMSKVVKSLYDDKSEKFEHFKKQQQHNAGKIYFELDRLKEITLPGIDFERNNCFLLPFLHPEREKFANQVSNAGVEIAPHFAKSIVWAEEFGYQPGTCKNAEKLAEQILVAPVHYNLKNKDIERLIKGIRTLTE